MLLCEQDRSRWNRKRIDEGLRIVERFLRMRRAGTYQLQALIALAHANAPSWEETRWYDILRAYDALLGFGDSPVVRLNRAIALWHVQGAAPALRALDELTGDLARYHLYHATRAEILRSVGRPEEARDADQRALELTENPAERALLERRLRD